MAPNPALYAHCANCGAAVPPPHRRRQVCRSCQVAAQPPSVAAMTRRDFIALPRRPGACALCGTPHPPGASNSRKYCDAHAQVARERCSRETTLARQRATGGWRVRKPERLMGDDLARSRADRTLDKGGILRYCGCGRKYRLDAFDTPCPTCGDALVPQPVTFDPETDL